MDVTRIELVAVAGLPGPEIIRGTRLTTAHGDRRAGLARRCTIGLDGAAPNPAVSSFGRTPRNT